MHVCVHKHAVTLQCGVLSAALGVAHSYPFISLTSLSISCSFSIFLIPGRQDLRSVQEGSVHVSVTNSSLSPLINALLPFLSLFFPLLSPDMETSSSPCPTPRSPSDSEAVTTYASESLVLKAADDFRLIIVIPDKKSFRMTWTFSVSPFVKRKNGAAKKTAADTSSPSSSSSSPQTTSNMDIGFTVIEKRGDGSLPQLIPYRCVILSPCL